MCKMTQYIDLGLPLQFSRENISYAFHLENLILEMEFKYLQMDQRLR